MDPAQVTSTRSATAMQDSEDPIPATPPIAADEHSPTGGSELPESYNADVSTDASSLDPPESRRFESEQHHTDQAKVSDSSGASSGEDHGAKKGTTLQSTLDAGAQAFGSVRDIVAKNLASLQASSETLKTEPIHTETPAASSQHQPQDPPQSGDVSGHEVMSASGPAAANEKPGFGSGISLASLGSRFQSLKQTAVKAVSQPMRHLVSQNKRRYMDGEYDLDLTYITENIIAMGFPAGDLSSGLFGYVEGFYRNHMEEVVRFLDDHHKGKCKIFNLCSERLYDSALFEGLVACFPFEDHNCPPLPLLKTFCDSAYDWLKRDMNHMVVVHCKAGKSRTGLMICCLLLYLKLFESADEAIKFYNSKRCTDNLGLTLPSQIRYVHYFETILRNGGETPQPEARILRGIRLHKCPYWIRPAIRVLDHNGVIFSTKKHPRTKDLTTDNLWHKAPRKGVMVFALPGERCVADLKGDFKVLFHDRHGDFYCWLNTSMIGSRQFLETKDLDWFDKRRLPSPGFQVEVVVLDPTRSESNAAATTSEPDASEPLAPRNLDGPMGFGTLSGGGKAADGLGAESGKGSTKGARLKTTKEQEEDEVFGESEEEPSPRVAPVSTSVTPPALGTLSAHLPGGKQVPGAAPGDGVRQDTSERPVHPSGTVSQPTPTADVAAPSNTRSSAGIRSSSDTAPSTTGQKAAPGEPSTTGASSKVAAPAPSQEPENTKGETVSANTGASQESASEHGGKETGTKKVTELPKAEPASVAPSAASVAPSAASSLLADDWEADVFGTEDAKLPGSLAAGQGAEQGKAGSAALTSDFAKIAVAGSASASEFTLGDDEDFDSDDGF